MPTGGGGGESDVGNVRPAMTFLTWDEKTKPMTRTDLYNFLSNPDNLSQREKDIVMNTAMGCVVGMPLGGLIGYCMSFLLPWSRTMKRVPEARQYIPAIRYVMAFIGFSLPFFYFQQYATESMLALNDEENILAFHVKRHIVAQRSQMMFVRSATREVTPEEQEAFGQANLTQRQAEAAVRSTGGSHVTSGGVTPLVDVNLALQQQSLTPSAQAGYK